MSHVSEPRLERVQPAPRDGVAVLELIGELDLAVHERFRALVDEVVVERPTLVVVDVAEVEFMDSTMLRELLRAHRALEEAGARLVVAGAQPAVSRLLELTGTHEVLALSESRDAALGSP
jgi:anti-sigma B factor antagonist